MGQTLHVNKIKKNDYFQFRKIVVFQREHNLIVIRDYLTFKMTLRWYGAHADINVDKSKLIQNTFTV